jgi:predicted nucleic acid-binding Zn ribbon protein
MRRSGATLQQIADKLNRTRERVRQILVKHYGSTNHNLISTETLRKQLGFSRYRLIDMYQNRVITPEREWHTNGICHLLWSPDTAEQVTGYLHTHRRCKMCHRPVPGGRRVFCSDACYLEDHKYKHKTAEKKRKHLDSVKRYREKRKMLSYSAV